MIRQIIISAFVVFSIIGFSSCEECVKCEIIANSLDTLTMIDTNNVSYDEFCGTPSEADAFREDVKYAAETRSCKVYSIRKIETGEVLTSKVYCGGIQDIKEYEYGLDSLLFTTYLNMDAEWVVDTIRSNPATVHCN